MSEAVETVRELIERVAERMGLEASVRVTEEQGEVHHAANNGTVPVVIYLATLFKSGEPAAIPDR